MISVEMLGEASVIERARSLSSAIAGGSSFAEAGRRMEAILRESTPAGYSRKLPESVILEPTEAGFVIGYGEGVETAGSPALDSVSRPRTSGRSVLARRRWASVDELQSVLETAVDESSGEILSVIERSVASGLS